MAARFQDERGRRKPTVGVNFFVAFSSSLLPLWEKVDRWREAAASRMRGLSPRREPLIRRGLHPRHLLPQGEKEKEALTPARRRWSSQAATTSSHPCR